VRESFNEYMMKIVDVIATRATCSRRQVGCVIVDDVSHIIATGFNGVPKGYPHCTDTPCGGEGYDTGEGLDACLSTHAEQNALIQCRRPNDVDTIFVSTSPCMSCAKLIANSSCIKVVCRTIYDQKAVDLLNKCGIQVLTC